MAIVAIVASVLCGIVVASAAVVSGAGAEVFMVSVYLLLALGIASRIERIAGRRRRTRRVSGAV